MCPPNSYLTWETQISMGDFTGNECTFFSVWSHTLKPFTFHVKWKEEFFIEDLQFTQTVCKYTVFSLYEANLHAHTDSLPHSYTECKLRKTGWMIKMMQTIPWWIFKSSCSMVAVTIIFAKTCNSHKNVVKSAETLTDRRKSLTDLQVRTKDCPNRNFYP